MMIFRLKIKTYLDLLGNDDLNSFIFLLYIQDSDGIDLVCVLCMIIVHGAF